MEECDVAAFYAQSQCKLDLAIDCFQQAPCVAQRALETAHDMSRLIMMGNPPFGLGLALPIAEMET